MQINPEVSQHLAKNDIVALESTVITHGLPYPQNENLALDMEQEVRENGCIPATVGMVNGELIIGLDKEQIHRLSTGTHLRKISQRDYGIGMAKKMDGGTTVAGTILASLQAGIHVFATGGIGGVHRGSIFDVSADLQVLSQYPMIVVCAGAKSILDLSATVEKLETLGIPVLGYQTDDFPAFYSTSSGLSVDLRVDTPEEVVEIAHYHWEMGIRSSILVVVPPPSDVALPYEEVEKEIQNAVKVAEEKGIRGAKVTPFLLEKMNQLTAGKSMHTNLALLKNNARVAALIAKAYSQQK
jgi:pseudouridine-5'-phosphate glycosidase